jgi:hypothetical protein
MLDELIPKLHNRGADIVKVIDISRNAGFAPFVRISVQQRFFTAQNGDSESFGMRLLMYITAKPASNA